jgi:hypothetical protein
MRTPFPTHHVDFIALAGAAAAAAVIVTRVPTRGLSEAMVYLTSRCVERHNNPVPPLSLARSLLAVILTADCMSVFKIRPAIASNSQQYRGKRKKTVHLTLKLLLSFVLSDVTHVTVVKGGQ